MLSNDIDGQLQPLNVSFESEPIDFISLNIVNKLPARVINDKGLVNLPSSIKHPEACKEKSPETGSSPALAPVKLLI